MNLDQVTATLRPRGEWESSDLGFRMIRRDAALVYGAWFLVTLPMLGIAIAISVFTPFPWLGGLLYWWLEPVADGPILHIISRRLFNEATSIRSVMRRVPELAWTNRLFILTPYRLHFARSVAMPITQLEGLSGEKRRSRAKVVNLKVYSHGVGLTGVYQHLVWALYFGIILTGYALVPVAYQDDLGDDWFGLFGLGMSGGTTGVTAMLAFYAAQSILQPWFVGAGFGLYINCRTQMEAWDIEVAFRRMVQRRSANTVALLLLVSLTAAGSWFPGDARADDSGQLSVVYGVPEDREAYRVWNEDEVSSAVESVYASEELNTRTTVETWQSIQTETREETESDGSFAWDVLSLIRSVFSVGLETLLWLGALLIVVALYLTRQRWLHYLAVPTVSMRGPRRVWLAGGELRAEDLPEDIPGETRRLWQAGDRRQALSLLYRGSVLSAVFRHGVRLPPSATESLCLAAVRGQTDPACADLFSRIVSLWMNCAYAHREPAEDAIDPLCRDWAMHFGESA